VFRVGVIALEPSAKSGGAYTFQYEIVRTLYEQPAVPGIEWIVVSPRDAVVSQLGLSSQSIQHVEMSLSARDHKIGLARKWLSTHLKSLVSGSRFKSKTERRSEFFESKLHTLHLDMLWYLGPHPPTQEIPYALTVWDIQHRLQPWFPEVSSKGIWMQRELLTISHLQRSTFIITGNNVGATQISSAYSIPPDRILVNPLPVPTDAIAYGQNPIGSQSMRSWWEGIGDFIIYPAQFWAHKNHKVLLEAIAHLASISDDVPKLVLTGSDKGNLDFIQSLTEKLQVSEHVINLGFVDRTDLLYLYSKATALVFPSMFGPDNIPPLEAMAIGCPVLVADDPGMREQLGSAAMHLSPTDPIEWASAVTTLSEDAELREMLITRGRTRIQSCTTEIYVDKVQSRLLEFKKIRETWPTQ
jgi:glycosyltransferase involved in cell wall biosynthesis